MFAGASMHKYMLCLALVFLVHPDRPSWCGAGVDWSIAGIRIGDAVQAVVQGVRQNRPSGRISNFEYDTRYCTFVLPRVLYGIKVETDQRTEYEKIEIAFEPNDGHCVVGIRRRVRFYWTPGHTPTIARLVDALVGKYGTPQEKKIRNGVVEMVWKKGMAVKENGSDRLKNVMSSIMELHTGLILFSKLDSDLADGVVFSATITPSFDGCSFVSDPAGFPVTVEYCLIDLKRAEMSVADLNARMLHGYDSQVAAAQAEGSKVDFEP
jgi:hypothetical protein